jgi:hypothetical protein
MAQQHPQQVFLALSKYSPDPLAAQVLAAAQKVRPTIITQLGMLKKAVFNRNELELLLITNRLLELEVPSYSESTGIADLALRKGLFEMTGANNKVYSF